MDEARRGRERSVGLGLAVAVVLSCTIGRLPNRRRAGAPASTRWTLFARSAALAGVRLAALALIPALLLARSAPGEAATTPTASDVPDPGAATQAEHQYEQWMAWLRAPAQVSARSQSKTAYENESADQAQGVDTSQFPGISAAGYHGLDPGPAARVLDQLGPNAALVEASNGQRSVAESALPLDGTTSDGVTAPLDLALKANGSSFVPASSLVPVTIPSTADGELTFPGADFGVSFGSGAPVAGRVVGGSILYPNIDGRSSDVDAVVRPLPFGADVSYMLRSHASPQSQTLSFQLPTGWQLHDPGDGSGTIQILSGDGKVSGDVLPALAVDAQGQTVPTSYQIASPNQLTLTVSHTSGDYAYPIMVDPPITGNYQGTSVYSDWYRASDDSANFTATNISGLSAWKQGEETTYSPGQYGEYIYTPPSGAYVYELTESGVVNNPDSYNAQVSQEYGGIWASGGGWEQGTWQNLTNSASGTPAEHGTTGALNSVDFKYCALAGCPHPSSSIGANNLAVFGLSVPSGGGGNTQGSNGADEVNDATVYLSDNVTPTISVTHNGYTPTSGTWVNNVNDTVTATSAVTTGLGISKLAVSGLSISPSSWSTTCSAGAVDVSNGKPAPMPCPSTFTKTFSYSTSSLSEGPNTVTVTATGAGGNTVTNSWQVNLDETAPTASISCPYSGWSSAASETCTITGADPPNGNGTAGSGLKTLEYRTQLNSGSWSDWTTVANNTPVTVTAEGATAIQAQAIDNAGNSSIGSATAELDRTAPTVNLSGVPVDDEGSNLPNGQYPLYMDIEDGSSTPTSGVSQVTVAVDGTARSGVTFDPCTPGPCATNASWNVSTSALGAGTHTITVTAQDGAGNSSPPQVLSLNIPPPPVDIAAAAQDVASGSGSATESDEVHATMDWIASESGVPSANVPYPTIEGSDWTAQPDVQALSSATTSAYDGGSVEAAAGDGLLSIAQDLKFLAPVEPELEPICVSSPIAAAGCIATAGAVAAVIQIGSNIETLFADTGQVNPLGGSGTCGSGSGSFPCGIQVYPERRVWWTDTGNQVLGGDGQCYEELAPTQADDSLTYAGIAGGHGNTGSPNRAVVPCGTSMPNGGLWLLELDLQQTYPQLSQPWFPGIQDAIDENSYQYNGDHCQGDSQQYGSNLWVAPYPGADPSSGWQRLKWSDPNPCTDAISYNGTNPPIYFDTEESYKPATAAHSGFPRPGSCSSSAPQCVTATVNPSSAWCATAQCLASSFSNSNYGPLEQFINSALGVNNPTTGQAYPPPGVITVPAPTLGETWATYQAALANAGFTNVQRQILDSTNADLDMPASAVTVVSPAPGQEVDSATPITVTTNPDGSSMPQATTRETSLGDFLETKDPAVNETNKLDIARSCLDAVDASNGNTDKTGDSGDASFASCSTMPVFYSGYDVREASQHDLEALAANPAWVQLNRDVVNKSGRGWYRGTSPCTLPTPSGESCDEYPFFSTTQGGPGASLKYINAAQNSLQGTRLNQFYNNNNNPSVGGIKGCDVQVTEPFLAVPLPPELSVNTTWTCNAEQ